MNLVIFFAKCCYSYISYVHVYLFLFSLPQLSICRYNTGGRYSILVRQSTKQVIVRFAPCGNWNQSM